MPQSSANGWHNDSSDAAPIITPRAPNGLRNPTTPGLGIALATPGIPFSEGARLSEDRDRPISSFSQPRKSGDYFSTGPTPDPNIALPTAGDSNVPLTPGVPQDEETKATVPEDGKDGATDPKDTPSKLGKRFRMNMSFNMKKLGKTAITTEKEKPAVVEEKTEAEADNKSEKTDNSREVEDNLLGTLQKIRFEYRDILAQQAQRQFAQDAAGGALGRAADLSLDSLITPSMPAETPVLKPPAKTTILIQEERPEAGGVADLFEGTVGSLRESVDVVEKVAPMWLGEILLRNQLPVKDVVKISFVLDPWQNQLPPIAADGYVLSHTMTSHKH